MKKILISDYDGTFDMFNYSIKYNVSAINKFRKDGNVFVLSSARNYDSIKPKINKYNIKYDYLNCLDGLVLFDRNDNLINTKYIESNIVCELTQIIRNKILMMNDTSTTSINDKIVCISSYAKSLKEYKKLLNILKTDFSDLEIFNFLNLFFIKPKSDKIDGIDIIKKIENINDNNIYTIGNDLNDLKMIEKYNGCSMLLSNPKIYKYSNTTTLSLNKYIQKINKY